MRPLLSTSATLPSRAPAQSPQQDGTHSRQAGVQGTRRQKPTKSQQRARNGMSDSSMLDRPRTERFTGPGAAGTAGITPPRQPPPGLTFFRKEPLPLALPAVQSAAGFLRVLLELEGHSGGRRPLDGEPPPALRLDAWPLTLRKQPATPAAHRRILLLVSHGRHSPPTLPAEDGRPSGCSVPPPTGAAILLCRTILLERFLLLP